MIPILGTLEEYLIMIDHWLIVSLSWATVILVLTYNIVVPRIRAKKLRQTIANSPNPRQKLAQNTTSEQTLATNMDGETS